MQISKSRKVQTAPGGWQRGTARAFALRFTLSRRIAAPSLGPVKGDRPDSFRPGSDAQSS